MEAADQTGHGIMNAPACRSGRFNQGHSISDGQQGNRSLMADHGFAGGAAYSLQGFAFGFGERSQGVGNGMRHGGRSKSFLSWDRVSSAFIRSHPLSTRQLTH